jgi:hypothetical protein
VPYAAAVPGTQENAPGIQGLKIPDASEKPTDEMDKFVRAYLLRASLQPVGVVYDSHDD